MSLFSRGRFARVGAVCAASSVLALLVTGNGAGATPRPSVNPNNLTATDLGAGQTISAASKPLSSRVAQSDPAVLNLTGSAPTAIMVKLDYDPLASYSGDLAGLPATSPQVTHQKLNVSSPAAVAYSSHINAVESGFVSALRQAAPSAKVGLSYHTLYGGLAVTVPANQVNSLLSLPGAVAVQNNSLHKIEATPVADDDAEFIGGNAAYGALGSSATAGAGVIVANVDTGIWPEHPSFAARADLPTTLPPTRDGLPRACNFGTDPLTNVAFTCNNKLIGGQVFLDTYKTLANDEAYPNSARDSNGHGTHTLSTSAGNPLTSAVLFGIDRGPIQGIAPGSMVMGYKALGPQGGFSSDLVAAIQQAVLDGANVINYSVGPGSPQSAYTSPDDLAFLDAFNAGVFASTSAGNSGPGAGTVSHLGPWETTVGASSLQRAFSSTVTLTAGGATLGIQGSTITPGIAAATPVVEATSVAGEDAFCSKLAAPGTFTGKIVVCVRGRNGRVQKGFNVKAGGAVGMLLRNPVVQDTETDNHFLPAVHFDQPAGAQLEAFLAAHPAGVTATFPAGQETNGQGDVMASFSSRGPGGDFLKPDIVAPGVQILAGNTPTPVNDVAAGPPGQLFQAIAGTSMAAPQITGSAALVFALHPGFSSAQVKSALMTTATRSVVQQDGVTPAGVFDLGAGRVDLSGVVDPGLTLDVTRAQMDAVLTDPVHRIDLNEPSVYDAAVPGRVTTTRVFKNVTTHPLAFKATVASDLTGAITVTPGVVNAPPGGTVTLTISIDATKGTIGSWYSGQIDLQQLGGSHHLHLPIAFEPSAPALGTVSLSNSCSVTLIHLSANQNSTCTAVAQNTALVPATVNLSTTWSDNLVLQSATPGATKTGRDTETLPPTVLAAARPADPQIAVGQTPAGGFLDLAGFTSTVHPLGDESITNLNVPAFQFAGATYTRIGVVSDGYLVVGGGGSADIAADPQHFPNTARPNNVLAPLWTDLDGGNGAIPGQGFRATRLSGGGKSWIVIQWNVHVYGSSATMETFQVWLGTNGTEDVSFGYGQVVDPGLAFRVGAENADGTAGSNFDSLPTASADLGLVVNSLPGAPGGAVSFAVNLRPNRTLPGLAPSTVETDMTTSVSRDTAVAKASIQVLP